MPARADCNTMATSLGDFDLTPELDARLTALARRAKGDLPARDALYQAFEFKVARFVRRYRYRYDRLVICELEDVAQEAFIVFCDLVERWPGQESFPGYFFSRFPWRLARAIDVIERGWSAARLRPLDGLLEAPVEPDLDDLFVLAEIGAGLGSRDRAVLELHIGYRMHLSEVARALGAHPQTIYRAWYRIVDELRATWFDVALPPRTGRRRQAS